MFCFTPAEPKTFLDKIDPNVELKAGGFYCFLVKDVGDPAAYWIELEREEMFKLAYTATMKCGSQIDDEEEDGEFAHLQYE